MNNKHQQTMGFILDVRACLQSNGSNKYSFASPFYHGTILPSISAQPCQFSTMLHADNPSYLQLVK